MGAVQQHAQVTSIQYALLLNPTTNLFDCFLYIDEGEANTVRERIQFNSQFSVIIPTGAEVNIESCYMPLIGNQALDGHTPVIWSITSKLMSPEIYPEFDFYGITPSLAPAGFYNEVKRGDLVKLFSLKVEGSKVDLSEVRLYDHDVDPNSGDFGMKNGDFSNGFTMGGYHQLYNGNKMIIQAEAIYPLLEYEK